MISIKTVNINDNENQLFEFVMVTKKVTEAVIAYPRNIYMSQTVYIKSRSI